MMTTAFLLVAEIACPADIQVMEDTDRPGVASVVWEPELFGNHSNIGVVTQDHFVCTDQHGNRVMSGGRYRVGETSVSCEPNRTVTRARGSCQFSVTVLRAVFFGNSNIVFVYLPHSEIF